MTNLFFFICLLKHRVLHYATVKASSLINACTALHNICISNNLHYIQLYTIIDNDGEFEVNDYSILNNETINEPNATRANIELIAGNRMQQH